jgi:hypothetical protein
MSNDCYLGPFSDAGLRLKIALWQQEPQIRGYSVTSMILLKKSILFS